MHKPIHLVMQIYLPGTCKALGPTRSSVLMSPICAGISEAAINCSYSASTAGDAILSALAVNTRITPSLQNHSKIYVQSDYLTTTSKHGTRLFFSLTNYQLICRFAILENFFKMFQNIILQKLISLWPHSRNQTDQSQTDVTAAKPFILTVLLLLLLLPYNYYFQPAFFTEVTLNRAKSTKKALLRITAEGF